MDFQETFEVTATDHFKIVIIMYVYLICYKTCISILPCTCITRTITNNDDDTTEIMQPAVNGNSGIVIMESSDSIDPPLSQSEVSSGQSGNGWVL